MLYTRVSRMHPVACVTVTQGARPTGRTIWTSQSTQDKGSIREVFDEYFRDSPQDERDRDFNNMITDSNINPTCAMIHHEPECYTVFYFV